MSESGKNYKNDNCIEDTVQKSFGFDDESLIAEFDSAAAELEDSELVPPKGEFEKIVAAVEAAEETSADISGQALGNEKRRRYLRRAVKAGLLVAVLGSMIFGTGIGASGDRAYEYWKRKSGDGRTIWNNADNIPAEYELDEAYQMIEDELGIEALQLSYIPEGMIFTSLVVHDTFARMEFKYQDQYLYFIMFLGNVENSSDATSDRKLIKKVSNGRLGIDIEVEEHMVDSGTKEYSAGFALEKSYYYLEGVMKEENFIEIVEKINHYKQRGE